MNFTIYEISSGQILRIVSAPESQIQSQCGDDEDFIVGAFDDDRFYIKDKSAVAFPPAPDGFFHKWDAKLEQWIDPRTLDELKAEKWTQIKAARTSAEHGGFTWSGSTFDSDPVSQQRITGAVTLAMMSTEFQIEWVLANNTTRELSQLDMIQVGVALGQHVAAQFAKGTMLRSQINAATTKEELNQISWS